ARQEGAQECRHEWAGPRLMDAFLQAAIDEARHGLAEGGIPIGSVLVHDGRIIGRGHNRRVQKGSAILHGEMDAIENAGRLPASTTRKGVHYTTLSPRHDGRFHSEAPSALERRHRRLAASLLKK